MHIFFFLLFLYAKSQRIIITKCRTSVSVASTFQSCSYFSPSFSRLLDWNCSIIYVLSSIDIVLSTLYLLNKLWFFDSVSNGPNDTNRIRCQSSSLDVWYTNISILWFYWFVFVERFPSMDDELLFAYAKCDVFICKHYLNGQILFLFGFFFRTSKTKITQNGFKMQSTSTQNLMLINWVNNVIVNFNKCQNFGRVAKCLGERRKNFP